MTVLILDEDIVFLFELRYFLKHPEWEVFSARNAQEALMTYNTIFFDVIITNHSLSGMDGLQLIQKIRSESPTTRFVLMSGEDSVLNYAKEKTPYVDLFLEKPFYREMLKNYLYDLHSSELSANLLG